MVSEDKYVYSDWMQTPEEMESNFLLILTFITLSYNAILL